MARLGGKLNPVAECRELKWGLWQCPPFLFLVMGILTIVSMIATYVLASRYVEEPELAALIVIFITILFLVMGNIIISGFNKIAETNRMKSEFISLVSHQLRGPLSIFRWTLDVLERQFRKMPDSNPENGNFVETLRNTSDNMIGLVNSLLEMSRIEAQTFVLREEVFSLDKVTKDIVANYLKYAEASNIALAVEIAPDIPEVRADRERIAIVIQNLVDNAVRYTLNRGNVLIMVRKDGEEILWSIKDEGVGIPVAQQKFIFQKFFRAKNLNSKSTKQTHGSGIGLYIAKEIITASKGKIGFTSEEGKGSEFWFRLPIK